MQKHQNDVKLCRVTVGWHQNQVTIIFSLWLWCRKSCPKLCSEKEKCCFPRGETKQNLTFHSKLTNRECALMLLIRWNHQHATVPRGNFTVPRETHFQANRTRFWILILSKTNLKLEKRLRSRFYTCRVASDSVCVLAPCPWGLCIQHATLKKAQFSRCVRENK